MRERLFFMLAIASGCSATFHALAATGWIAVDVASPVRHLVFVAINAGVGWYVIKRPLWLLPAYVVLVVQQTHGHGGRALRWWVNEGRVDVLSGAVLLALYGGLVLLVLDARDRSPTIRRLLCRQRPA